MVKLKFKQSGKPIKLKFFNASLYPRRSKAEWKLIDRKPFEDTDRDGVPNWFDCKPLNRKKQDFKTMEKIRSGEIKVDPTIKKHMEKINKYNTTFFCCSGMAKEHDINNIDHADIEAYLATKEPLTLPKKSMFSFDKKASNPINQIGSQRYVYGIIGKNKNSEMKRLERGGEHEIPSEREKELFEKARIQGHRRRLRITDERLEKEWDKLANENIDEDSDKIDIDTKDNQISDTAEDANIKSIEIKDED